MFEKIWSQSRWFNKETSKTTPLGATRLNEINDAIDTIDDRVVQLDVTKAEVSEVMQCVSDVFYDEYSGRLGFEWKNGRFDVVDLNIEKIPVMFSMDENGVITMECEDGTIYTCDVGSLIPVFSFEGSDAISLTSLRQDDGTYKVTAIIKDGSITDKMIESQYLAKLTTLTNQSKEYEQASGGNATMARSWSSGGTGTRTDEEVNNAKYWAARAGASASEASDSLELHREIAIKTPYVGENGNWYVWSNTEQAYIDSGTKAQGLKGDKGEALAADAVWCFNINEKGHLVVSYPGDTAPDFFIDDYGHLILNI